MRRFPSLQRTRRSRRADRVALGAALALAAAAGPAHADWSVEVQPMFMEIYGHDQHVVTVHRTDPGGTFDDKTAVLLDTDSELQYRTEIRWTRPNWTWGLDFLWVRASQSAGPLTANAGGGGEEVVFEVADQGFASTGPNQVLFYNVLEDTTIESWTLDLYGLRTVAETPATTLRLQLGIRSADFDNDYRSVVGLRDVGGTRLDASSNYDRMTGPLVGLLGEVRFGKSTFEGYLGQSVVIGKVQLTGQSRQFTGTFDFAEGFMPDFFAEEILRSGHDVAIPITEARLKWTRRLGEHFAFGAGINAAAWWDVPVPPGVVPGVDGDEALLENTLVFVGVLASVKYTF
jgi:hypothetical protein